MDNCPWGHITVLLDKLKTRAELDFYAGEAVKHGWSRGVLQHWIANRLHATRGAAVTNFDQTLPEGSDAVRELVKDPCHLDFELDGNAKERDLEDALVARLVTFLTELGVGFAFMGRQYPVVVGGETLRIDLLFYHAESRAARNEAVIEYALSANNRPLASSTYIGLPPQVRRLLPSEGDLAKVAHDATGGSD